jgi:threonine dehydrogenase-like Zn-dependent dehydrogenase
MTGGRGPDACIDAVGLEAHGETLDAMFDNVAQAVMMESDRPHVLRQAIQACRKGGTVSIPGVYGGIVDKIPMGAAFNKGLTFKMGQTHMHSYMEPLLQRVQEDEIDPSFIISHRLKLDDAPKGYDMFLNKYDDCTKVVLKP